jgi:hypothetical protein
MAIDVDYAEASEALHRLLLTIEAIHHLAVDRQVRSEA